ncbi:MAG: 50S ribosomal protein L32e [Candidatus Thorarchaeota archaeon]
MSEKPKTTRRKTRGEEKAKPEETESITPKTKRKTPTEESGEGTRTTTTRRKTPRQREESVTDQPQVPQEPVETGKELVMAEAKPATRRSKKSDTKTAISEKPATTEKKTSTTTTRTKVKKVVTEPPKVVKPEILTREEIRKSRLMRIAEEMKKRQPDFRRDQAHRWKRLSDSWRKVRGNDNDARRRCRGHIALVAVGYRKPAAIRGIHPSGYREILVHHASEIEGLDPKIHAIRIAGTMGSRKRTQLVRAAETAGLRVLNLNVPKSTTEGELFSELEGMEELEE